MRDIIMNGTWKNFDKQIAAAELAAEQKRDQEAETLEDYFSNKEKLRLSRLKVKDMSWTDVNSLHCLNKIAENEQPEDINEAVAETLQECIAAAGNRPDIQELLLNVQAAMDGSVSISKSDNMVISGFASSEVIDHQNHRVPMTVLRKALPEFLEHATVLLGHGNRPVGRVTDYLFKKTDSGSDGLFITVKLFKGCEDVAQEIGKSIFSFSIGGYANLRDQCQKAVCHKDVTNLKLYEISLVPRGANSDAVIKI